MSENIAESAERVFHEYPQNNTTVEIVGRRVTVSFDVPFRRGDKFISPITFKEQRVSLAPPVTIRLGANDGAELKLSEIHMGGQWYTDDHRQMSGPAEFTPTDEAMLDYWCGQRWEWLESRVSSLRKHFDGQPLALAKLQAAVEAALTKEIEIRKLRMSTEIVNTSKRIAAFEETLEKFREGSK